MKFPKDEENINPNNFSLQIYRNMSQLFVAESSKCNKQ